MVTISSILDQGRYQFKPWWKRDISGSANNGNVGGNANAGAGSVNVGNGISNGKNLNCNILHYIVLNSLLTISL